MHFAYPARKSSNPPPFQPRRSHGSRLPTFSARERSRIKIACLALLALATIAYFFSKPAHGPRAQRAPSGDPPVVIVTVLDHTKYNKPYLDVITENREAYAAKHGRLPNLLTQCEHDSPWRNVRNLD
jgi:mannan polymerase II complex MNN11 subunit